MVPAIHPCWCKLFTCLTIRSINVALLAIHGSSAGMCSTFRSQLSAVRGARAQGFGPGQVERCVHGTVSVRLRNYIGMSKVD